MSVSVKRLGVRRFIALDGGGGIFVSGATACTFFALLFTRPGSIVIAIFATFVFAIFILAVLFSLVIVIIASRNTTADARCGRCAH
jgi:hypothetical protein